MKNTSLSDLAEDGKEFAETKKAELQDKAAATANKASHALDDARDEGTGVFANLMGRASDTADKVKDFAETQKNAGAGAMRSIANVVHGAASTLDSQAPAVANVGHKVADSMTSASKDLEKSSVDELMAAVSNMAKKQPIGTLVGAFLAGIVLTRLFSAKDR